MNLLANTFGLYRSYYVKDRVWHALFLVLIAVRAAALYVVSRLLWAGTDTLTDLAVVAGAIGCYSVLSFLGDMVASRWLIYMPMSRMMEARFRETIRTDHEQFMNDGRFRAIFATLEEPQMIIEHVWATFQLIGHAAVALVITVTLLRDFPWATLAVAAFAIAFEAMILRRTRQGERKWSELSRRFEYYQSRIVARMRAIQSIKIMGLSQAVTSEIENDAGAYTQSVSRAKGFDVEIRILYGVRAFLVQILFVLLAVLFHANSILTISMAIAAVFFVDAFQSSLSTALESALTWNRTRGVVSEFVTHSDQDRKRTIITPRPWQSGISDTSVELLDVTVVGGRDQERSRVLVKGLSLSAKNGENIALVGPNGAGKSTLLRTIFGLSNPECGTVAAYGSVGVGHSESASWALYIGDSPHVFNTTLDENLRMGLPASEGKVSNVLLGLELGSLTDGLSSVSTERLDRDAKTISAGERARVGLGRCLLRSSRCRLLFVDETLRNLDSRTRIHVLEYLLSAFRESTVFIATHQENVIERLDVVWYLDPNTKAVEIMTPAQYLSRSLQANT